MCERGPPFAEGELRNNNQHGGVLPDGDANANDIRGRGKTGDTGALSGRMADAAERDKVVIWGTDSQCDDPELAEFEMLECQELEAYLVEEGEDFVGLTDREELQAQPAEDQAVDNKSREERKEFKDVSRTDPSSATDVFVTCLSAITRTDTNMASGPYSTISEDPTLASYACSTVSEGDKDPQPARHPSSASHKSTTLQKDVDVNLNSTDLSRAQSGNGVIPRTDAGDEHKRNNNSQANKAGQTGEHKVLPTAIKPQDEKNSKLDKSTQANVNYRAPNAGTKGNLSSADSKGVKKQGSFDNTLIKQNSFDKTSFENTLKKQRSFDNTLKKQRSFENTVTSGSSSLERRKPWGSPSRPPASCSPKRRPPGSPAKVQGVRAPSLERSSSPQTGLSQTVKPPAKTALVSGIPKPVVPPQQREPELQKPKNVRPKIITYVRKNPQANPDAPNEACAHPLRLSSYSGHDPKAGPQPKSTPAPCSSNLLFDRYRQELQKVGYHPPSTKPPGRSGSFHEEEVE